MFNYTPSHEEIIAQCTINGEGYGSNARMYAEFDLFGIKELAWAREVVELADVGIHRYKAAKEAERKAQAVDEARNKVFNNAKDRWAKSKYEEPTVFQCSMGG